MLLFLYNTRSVHIPRVFHLFLPITIEIHDFNIVYVSHIVHFILLTHLFYNWKSHFLISINFSHPPRLSPLATTSLYSTLMILFLFSYVCSFILLFKLSSAMHICICTLGLPVHHQLPELTQTQVHRVGDAIQPSHPLSPPSPHAPNPSQHQSLFQ